MTQSDSLYFKELREIVGVRKASQVRGLKVLIRAYCGSKRLGSLSAKIIFAKLRV